MKFRQCTALGAAALLATSQMAFADTTSLICHLNVGGSVVEDEPTTVELNEAQNTVVVHFGANHYIVGNGDVEAAESVGPLPATFGSDQITFNLDTAYAGPYTLDRLTGVLMNTDTKWHWACQAGKRQF